MKVFNKSVKCMVFLTSIYIIILLSRSTVEEFTG